MYDGMNPSFEAADFAFSLDEVDLIEKSDKSGDDTWAMAGWASTPTQDQQDEAIIQKGLNLEPFLKGGWVNWDHDRLKIIGWPTVGDLRQNPKSGGTSFYTEFKLLKGHPIAKMVWETAKALKANNAPRSLGLSVEGRRRDVDKKGRILKADIFGVAVTPYPVNPEASASILIKSMLPHEGEYSYPSIMLPESNSVAGAISELAKTLQKAMTTGSDVGGTSQSGAGAIRKEELDGAQYLMFDPSTFDAFQAGKLDDKPKSKALYESLKKKAQERDGKITKGEATIILTLLGYPMERILNLF